MEHHTTVARRKAEGEFTAMATIRKRWAGAGMKESFYEWKDWVINKTKRRRRDLRKMWRVKYRHFTAAMESVNIAEAQVLLWIRQNDAFTDAPFWRHSNTNEMSWTKPHIMMYLPGHFEVPSPPDALPPGVSIDDSTDEEKDKKDGEEDGKNNKKGKESGATLLEDALGEDEKEEDEEESSEEESGTEGDDEFDAGGSELGTDAGTEVGTNDGTEGGMESVGSGSADGSGKGSVGSVGGASQKSIMSGRSSKSGGGSRNSRVSGSHVPDSPSVRTQLGGDWDAGEEKETFDASHDEEARMRTGAGSLGVRQGNVSGNGPMAAAAATAEEEEVHANIADAGLAHDGIDSVKKWRLLQSAQVPPTARNRPGLDPQLSASLVCSYYCPLPYPLPRCTHTNTILPLTLPPPPPGFSGRLRKHHRDPRRRHA